MFLISFVQPSHRRSLLRLSAILFIFAAVFADNKLAESTGAAPATAAAPVSAPPPPQPGGLRNYNFDGDGAGRADIGRWRPANTEFRVFDNSGNFRIYTLGTSAAKAAPGDFNGDGTTDAGVFENGTWTYKTSPWAAAQTISLGAGGDIPAAGDFDGDGITDAAVFRPLTGQWLIRKSLTPLVIDTISFGAGGDIPIADDFDGDGQDRSCSLQTVQWHVVYPTQL